MRVKQRESLQGNDDERSVAVMHSVQFEVRNSDVVEGVLNVTFSALFKVRSGKTATTRARSSSGSVRDE